MIRLIRSNPCCCYQTFSYQPTSTLPLCGGEPVLPSGQISASVRTSFCVFHIGDCLWRCVTVSTFLCPTSRPDIALLWFLIPFKAAKNLICNQYRWLTIKIVTALLLLAILALFLYNMPGYMVKKMLGVWDVCRILLFHTYKSFYPSISLCSCFCFLPFDKF